ncbi:RluA family pseudouridine synthase [Shewanella sp. HN-41]|uniref:RluA family pseudouridine synthase n=1 Tax=Shewanella sp. HN-41 TaxID=327275 RepID=UPI0002125C4F|nr:RluA family pseudouridine synthase [Shewanella sp. HN-41]EGM71122.1 ribosomal large subunit pseudouridine synthase A [Shewanella sp. HN-41]
MPLTYDPHVRVDTFIAPPCEGQIKILYQDSDILLIDKPSGLLSLSGKNPLNLDSVHHRLVQDFPSATLVHRLDFGTSGIMLVARSKIVNGLLTKQFQARTVQKCYTALLHGHLTYDSGVINLPIAKDSDNFPLQKICHSTGKPAISEYRVLERLAEPFATRVEFTPVSGRTHQLRLHSQQLGHSILGCDLYGGVGERRTDTVDAHDEISKTKCHPRLMLHATRLAFDHPITGERIDWICESPF